MMHRAAAAAAARSVPAGRTLGAAARRAWTIDVGCRGSGMSREWLAGVRGAVGAQQQRWLATAPQTPEQPDEEYFGNPLQLVEGELAAMSSNIEGLLSNQSSPVLEAAAQYFFQGQQGKQIRPSVVLLMSQATTAHTGGVAQANESQQRLAEIAEMIHTASLLHDDVVDESDVRRGKATVSAKFGNKVAVLAGDFLLARASMALARLRDTEVVEVVSLVIEELVEGELLQVTTCATPATT